ncbi:MAG: hypothetical protein AAGA48_35895 [Myxococcota bacterium]
MPSPLSMWLFIACSSETQLGQASEAPRPSLGTEAPSPETVEDRIIQMATPEVDVLWVIDPSCSMGPYQEALTTHFPSFIQYFLDSGLDWHVGVTSTDMDGVLSDGSEGRLRTLGGAPYLTPKTPDPEARFTEIASMGTQGSSSERGTSAIHSALTIRLLNDNRGFLRPGAALHTIVISDESNQIADGELHFDGWIRWYQALKSAVEMRTFSVITSPLGIDYERASNRIGGTSWAIDTDAWDVVLERLGLAAAGVHREFFLSRVPVVETLEVWLELDGVPGQTEERVVILLTPAQEHAAPDETDGHYRFDTRRNAIRLLEPPPETTRLVRIRYVPTGGLPR